MSKGGTVKYVGRNKKTGELCFFHAGGFIPEDAIGFAPEDEECLPSELEEVKNKKHKKRVPFVGEIEFDSEFKVDVAKKAERVAADERAGLPWWKRIFS